LLRTRAELRADIDRIFADAGMPDLAVWLDDAESLVYAFEKEQQ
jgi:hypothetical protein